MSPVRVLVIDDSAYSRRTITRILEEMPEVEVIGFASNGEEGLRRIREAKPDLVTLDLEMPVMDGFTLLRIIMSTSPLPVIVISSRSDDERVFKALELGAVDFIAKPGGAISVELGNIRDDLQMKVRSVMQLNRETLAGRRPASAPKSPELVAFSASRIQLLVVGASTGGPPAIQRLLTLLPSRLPCALLIAQHMPVGFTSAFAERLDRLCPFPVREARDGDEVSPGTALVAPGGWNMTVERRDVPRIVLSRPDPLERYVPSIDTLLVSVARTYGQRSLALILTGMGSDGLKGARAIKEAGGAVMAESENSAVVFGMPREVIAAGLADRVVALDEAAEAVLEFMSTGPSTPRR